MVLAAGLGDPAQLVGCHQLFEVVHPLPQCLTLVGVLHEDAMIFGFQNILLRGDIMEITEAEIEIITRQIVKIIINHQRDASAVIPEDADDE